MMRERFSTPDRTPLPLNEEFDKEEPSVDLE
jgi:hypothetical protein